MNSSCEGFITSRIECDKGEIFIEGPVSAEYLKGLDFDENLRNFRVADRQKQSLCEIACSPDGFLYIARDGDTVIGYVTFHYPDPYTRWHRHPMVLELGAIEVSPQWRKYRMGRHLLLQAFTNPLMRIHIVITMEYCWHWDLENCRMSLWQYQIMLTRLFGAVGLQKVETDDPEILEHPANVLMVRIGEDVTQEDIDAFDRMRLKK